MSSQVVANRKENLSPENNINIESAGGISPRPPGRGRNGMVTRATNASKHPGFLALDEEDLKARRKKDDAALCRRAKAEEKKSNQVRLEANVHRIAAFEDGLSIQHAATLENAARPATRASQVKATHSMQVEPVSVESDQSKIRTEDDSIEGAHVQEIVESDASCADDLDYVESESKGPLTVRRCVAFCTLSLLMVTRIPMAKMKTLRRLALNTAARRFLSSVKLERILKLTVMWSRGQMTRAMRPQTLVNISILTHTCKSLIPRPTALSLQTGHTNFM